MSAQIARFENAERIDGVAPTRTSHATLVSGKSTPMTRSELAMLPAPVGTDTHKPVAHIELIRNVEHVLGDNGIAITAEKYSVNRQGNALFGVMDLVGMNALSIPGGSMPLAQTDKLGFAAALGLRTANDKTMSIQLGVGAKVFICDNLSFHADMIALKRKHTAGLDLLGELKEAVKRFIEKFWQMSVQFDELKNRKITEADAKVKIYDIFAKQVIAPRYFPLVNAAYFMPTFEEYEEQYVGTMWSLHNAFTWALKPAPLPVQQSVALELAREFSLT
jgi:hypothetical protein